MRLSIDRNDPGHALFSEIRRRRQRVAIFFNGEPQTHAVTVDSETGFIRRFVIRATAAGMVRVVDKKAPAGFATEDFIGEVRIEFGLGAVTPRPAGHANQLSGSGPNASERIAAAQAKRARKAARLSRIEAAGGLGPRVAS